MKKLKQLITVIILLLSWGCNKEGNTPPRVEAGPNIHVFLPLDSAFLNGSTSDAENNIESCRWSQFSGPGLAIIPTPDSFKTKISNLLKGKYSFELRVTDKGGLVGKDTVHIDVIDTSGTNILLFEALDLICWGPECSIVVDTSNTHIYQNLPIKVFLKSMDTSVWVEIPQENYFFSPNGSSFYIEWYGLDDSKKWQVMIVY